MRPGMCETHVNEAVYCQVCHEELLSDYVAALEADLARLKAERDERAMAARWFAERAEQAKADLARVTAERDRHKEGAEGWRNALSDVRDELGLAAGGVGLSLAQEIAAIKAERDQARAEVAALTAVLRSDAMTYVLRYAVRNAEKMCIDEQPGWVDQIQAAQQAALANLPAAAARLLAERSRYREALEVIAGGDGDARATAQRALTAAPSESPS